MTESRAIVERYFAAFGAGDIDAAMACAHLDAIWRVDGDPVVGTVGIIQRRGAVHAWQVRFPESFRALDFAVDRRSPTIPRWSHWAASDTASCRPVRLSIAAMPSASPSATA